MCKWPQDELFSAAGYEALKGTMSSEHLHIRVVLHPVSYIQLQSCNSAPMQSDHPEGILYTLHGFPQRANFPCRWVNARCLTKMPSRTAANPAMEWCYRKRILRGWAERRNGLDHICSPRWWRGSSFSVNNEVSWLYFGGRCALSLSLCWAPLGIYWVSVGSNQILTERNLQCAASSLKGILVSLEKEMSPVWSPELFTIGTGFPAKIYRTGSRKGWLPFVSL